jgi:hypothetical protein
VFLDAAERRWLEELGGMNIFFVMDDGSITTPPLGTILPGITRSSIISVADEMGIRVDEQPYSFDQLKSDAASGKLKEVFACGTAAVVTTIGVIRFSGGSFTISDGKVGPVTSNLNAALVGIQRGLWPDRLKWRHVVQGARLAERRYCDALPRLNSAPPTGEADHAELDGHRDGFELLCKLGREAFASVKSFRASQSTAR